jgi:hypothetical protein
MGRPRACLLARGAAARGAGPSGLAALSLRRTGLPGRRSCSGAREGSFSGRWILGKSDCLIILLADNYNRATTGRHRGTERTEYAQRLFGGSFEAAYGLTILAGGGPAAPCSPSTVDQDIRARVARYPGRGRVHLWAFLPWGAGECNCIQWQF